MDATAIVPWLFLAGLARMLMVPTGWVYVASGRPKRMLAWQLMWTPFVVLSFVIGLPYGALGVATAYAIVNCLGLGPSYAFCFRGSNIRLSDVFVTLLAPALCTIGCAVAATVIQLAAASSIIPGPWRLSLRLGIAAILYAVCTARFVPMAKGSLKAILKRTQPPEP
jgi:PST family polysaccharide transporter